MSTNSKHPLCNHVCRCSIIPSDVLRRFAEDEKLTEKERKQFADTALIDGELRKLRFQAGKLTSIINALSLAPAAIPGTPQITVANCNHSQSLPGTPIIAPGNSSDSTIKQAFVETKAVADFYQQVFARNSIDNAGMTLGSSVHYGTNYNNAFWNGMRMTYGDGDGNIFIDFTQSNDVICHELTHGVTQHTMQLSYTNEAGGLNESMSDVFGSMFRQWRLDQTVQSADWLIGHDIMGPGAIARHFTCLRDMSDPGAAHCLAPQPFHFSQYQTGMDPHYSSGIPNFAFYKISMSVGGRSWEKVGKIWYKAMVGFRPSPNMRMKTFANRTRKLAVSMFPSDAALHSAVNTGWLAVGL